MSHVSFATPLRKLRYKIGFLFVPTFKVKTGFGAISVKAITPASRTLPYVWKNTWRLELMKKIFAFRQGVFIDVGANTGQTLLDYLESGSNCGYFGFEPNPECVVLLNHIMQRNKLNNVSIIPAGFADGNTVLRLFVADKSDADSGGSLIEDFRPKKQLKSLNVPVYRFDDIRDDLGIDKISLIKIDTEGAELVCLSGMKQTLLTRRPWIIVEVLHRDPHADSTEYNKRLDEIVILIKSAGYCLNQIQKTKDESSIISLQLLDDFPRAVWSLENKHECDYLLTPSEEIADVQGLNFVPS
jgi:FkbM family methyltransferase